MNNITDKAFWEAAFQDVPFQPMAADYPLVQKIDEHFGGADNAAKNVLEIGCFPGRFLYHFGRLGYQLNGIDQVDALDKMVDWFRTHHFQLGQFTQGDFFALPKCPQYDIVFSSGFIEHFTHFEAVIRAHTQMVKPGGFIYLSAPNFAGTLQKFLHTWLDKANLDAHYLPSMDYDRWAAVLETAGFSVMDGGYLGGFDFWIGGGGKPAAKACSTADPEIFVHQKAAQPSLLFARDFYHRP
jgi:SAM-dependent methyltransferase